MTDNCADELRKLADKLDEAKRELNLAREQSTKAMHLYIRARRAAVQAARAVAAAVDLGFSEIWPQGWWVLSAMRNPDDPDRPPATIQVGERKAEIRSMKIGSGCNPDGTLRDDTAFAVWIQQICPVMRSRHTTGKADAGAFDIPKVKTDDQGRILGRDGKPLQPVEKTDPETGEPAGSYLQGPEARVTDDYDEADTLEHLRCQAADWVDACDVAADLIRKKSTIAGDDEAEPTKPTAPTKADASREESYPTPQSYGRDKWIYENIGQNTCDTLSRKLREKAKVKKWDIISSRNGFKKAADRYADYHSLEKRRFATE